MKFQRHLRGGMLATTIAVTASLGGAAPAQAQENGEVCFDFSAQCVTVPLCNAGVCVSGIPENFEAIREMADETVQEILDQIPEEVCTPPLPRQPICVRT